MAGYTPVFDSVFHGTLCGRWPTLPVWMTILPMADKNGHIDMTYQAMSALTGWPIDLLRTAIEDLMRPDPDSRSAEEGGRRLVLIDPSRNWGWRVVNHRKYREKARLSAYEAQRVASGKNAERMAERKKQDETHADPRTPTHTHADPPSNSNANTEERPRKRGSRLPEDWTPDDRDAEYAASLGLDVARVAERFRNYWHAKAGRDATKLDWSKTWRNWCASDAERRHARGIGGHDRVVV